MTLTKEKLLALWRKRGEIFANPANSDIIDRFNELDKLFADISSYTVINDASSPQPVTVNGSELKFRDNTPVSKSYFSCRDDETTAAGAFEGVKVQANVLPPEYTDIIYRIACMMGGFDFKNHYRMADEYRIISNIITYGHDRGSLSSYGQQRHPSSNFADNNYFFNVILTVNDIRRDIFNPDLSKLTLRWPHHSYYPKQEEAESSQKDALKHRFPYKFFYMWSHPGTLRLAGLMAYKELILQHSPDIAYQGDRNLDQPFDAFCTEWPKYSHKIENLIPQEEQGQDFWTDMSKLLSIVMIRSQSIRNLTELIETGNKAVILYGPPGTGKTFSAKKIITEKLGVSSSELKDCQFPSIGQTGAWALVQFHPNYGYEDFIGGISPKLTGDTLSYTLKTGIFKKFCDKAAREPGKDFIFVIDEINRADLSAVFGELLYAIEYRDTPIDLPNFEDKFVIPANVFIIGTMNSIDKSLVTFDLALRRRFAFYKIMPDLNVIDDMLASLNINYDDQASFISRCKKLNEKISDPATLHLGKDYQIGQAYYAKIRDFLNPSPSSDQVQSITALELEKLWEYHLEPLILEYVGNRMDDESVITQIDAIKKKFIEA